jgi:hypothetical protein
MDLQPSVFPLDLVPQKLARLLLEPFSVVFAQKGRAVSRCSSLILLNQILAMFLEQSAPQYYHCTRSPGRQNAMKMDELL